MEKLTVNQCNEYVMTHHKVNWHRNRISSNTFIVRRERTKSGKTAINYSPSPRIDFFPTEVQDVVYYCSFQNVSAMFFANKKLIITLRTPNLET